MHALHDTLVMAKRSLRHTIRSLDTIITVAATPIVLMLLFVYVLGGSFDTGSVKYINFVTPGIIILCVVSGIAYAALRLNNDMTKGMINRFRCMPIAPSSILGGHAVSSVLSNLFSVALVMIVALLIGFRSGAGLAQWLTFGGILLLFTAATTWLAIVFGLLAKSAEGAGAFSYILFTMIFISSAFTPTATMNPVVRAFAENQPMTPIIETMRSLLVNGTAGSSAWIAVAWCAGLLVVSYFLALRIYKTKTV
ncbi:MAG TPA: ABC transporter permease [Candidatus Saccharimonadia bacterium]|nr:ABC transporter permease [Candidatus Saccharimonadia bacterium]